MDSDRQVRFVKHREGGIWKNVIYAQSRAAQRQLVGVVWCKVSP